MDKKKLQRVLQRELEWKYGQLAEPIAETVVYIVEDFEYDQLKPVREALDELSGFPPKVCAKELLVKTLDKVIKAVR